MSGTPTFIERLRSGPPVLLDGPTGTELQRRGVETDLPQWSAAALVTAPAGVSAIHRDYVNAGAELLTANTFRTHRLNLAAVGWEERALELTTLAVRLAREAAAAASRPVWVAGSQAPIADCYTPFATPDDAVLESEHRRMSEQLATAGVDAILVETHPTLREALAATRAALATGLPVITCVVCGREGRLLSGESLSDAAQEIARLPVAALGINCVLAEGALGMLQTVRSAADNVPTCVYANVGYLDPNGGWVNAASTDPAVYCDHARDWVSAGARIIGSCCGTSLDHIRRLREMLDDERPARNAAAVP